jgi:hypothetical protein
VYKSSYIRTACIDDVPNVARKLKADDLREVREGLGQNPVLALASLVLDTEAVVFNVPNGKTAGMAGVSKDGLIWMLCTDAISEYPKTFVREAKRWVDSLPHPILWNRADIRNTTHLRLLRFLGFTFIQVLPSGPNNKLFVEFLKL